MSLSEADNVVLRFADDFPASLQSLYADLDGLWMDFAHLPTHGRLSVDSGDLSEIVIRPSDRFEFDDHDKRCAQVWLLVLEAG